MCGRYVQVSSVKTIEKRFNVVAPAPQHHVPNTNVSVGEKAPVITNADPGTLQWFQFGFSPSWAKKQFYLFNARAEGDLNKSNDPNFTGAKGIINKPMFRTAIRRQRCLVPADAFYEGPEKEKLSKPYCVYLRNKERPFAFAGIWDTYVNRETGEELGTFAIITTTANEVTGRIGHHRSPVILPREAESIWLDSDLPLAQVTDLLRPFPGERMNAYPVDPILKNPRLNGPDLLKPTGERLFPEEEYRIENEIRLEGMGQTQARRRKNEEE